MADCQAIRIDRSVIANNEHWQGDDIDIMQYTGLLDKNGSEIYEGDIVKCADEIGIVLYFGANFQVNWDPVSTYATYLFLCAKDSEIIGNIYENPELLKP